jgi:hypothetical protein
MRGKAITDGPLPFVFGAKAATLKARYWMRDETPKDRIGKEIWLSAYPRFQSDAANFYSATVILSDGDYLPMGVIVVLPGSKGKANHTYMFAKRVVNDKFDWLKGDFDPPSTPIGWKKVVEAVPAGPGEEAQQSDPAQARRAPKDNHRK